MFRLDRDKKKEYEILPIWQASPTLNMLNVKKYAKRNY